jgi:hypothetical protein
MQSRLGLIAFVAFVGGGVVIGCGASGSTGDSSGFNSPSCDASGDCPGIDGGVAPPIGTLEAGPPSCGDGICNGTESCRTCPRDCGECAKCSLAPSCSNALGIPANPTPRADLDQGVDVDAGPDGGKPSTTGSNLCKDPELRLRIEKVTTYKGGGQVYCVIDATDGTTSEVAITTKTKSLGGGETNYFDPATSMFWGQKDLHTTTNNLTVTYNCFVVKSDAWAKVFGAMGDASNKAGGIAGPYGWAFGIGSGAAGAAAAAVQAAAGDSLVFNAQQTIDKAELLDLTNGRTWSIRKSGGGLFDSWDWQIDVQSWGCADGIERNR